MAPTLFGRLIFSAVVTSSLALPARAQDSVTTDSGTFDQSTAAQLFREPPYSPYAGRNFPTRPFFGDTHLHTSFSMDAGAFGARLGPRDAYRFAKGEEITASSGQPVETVPAARLPGRGRSLRQLGFFPRICLRGDPNVAGRPARAAAGMT